MSLSKSQSNLQTQTFQNDLKYAYDREEPKLTEVEEVEKKFPLVLFKMVKLLKKIERARVSLNKRPDFDPLLLFSFFDKYVAAPKDGDQPVFESKQYLDLRKFKSSMKKLGISMTSSRLK